MSDSLVLAVDGGNAKTDLALVSADGEALALVRGPGSSPHEHGVEGALDRIESLLEQALARSGRNGAGARTIAIAELLLAGVDFPGEVAAARARAEARGWAQRVEVGNDTFAVLRAGTDRGWGIAVVCGAGINCLGLARDGRQARFPALGPITGDWGGGYDVGLAAVTAAARSEDGRGPRTSLEHAVPAHFGLQTPLELAEAVHTGVISQRRVVELAPLVLAEAAADDVAAGIVMRLALEVVALVRVALARLGPVEEPVEVVLGGGLMQARDRGLLAAIDAGLSELGIALSTIVVDLPPVVGAALLALDALGAPPAAQARLRSELGAAAEQRTNHIAEVTHG
jgi:N-acetylglucosamine kinase-like BadF-type ATPase